MSNEPQHLSEIHWFLPEKCAHEIEKTECEICYVKGGCFNSLSVAEINSLNNILYFWENEHQKNPLASAFGWRTYECAKQLRTIVQKESRLRVDAWRAKYPTADWD